MRKKITCLLQTKGDVKHMIKLHFVQLSSEEEIKIGKLLLKSELACNEIIIFGMMKNDSTTGIKQSLLFS